MIEFYWRGLNDMVSAVLSVERAPQRAKPKLDRIMRGIFRETQANVHVDTGALKASGELDTGIIGDTWEGEISYGDEDVPQAIFEIILGGDHDYMRDVEDHNAEILDAMAWSMVPRR